VQSICTIDKILLMVPLVFLSMSVSKESAFSYMNIEKSSFIEFLIFYRTLFSLLLFEWRSSVVI
jgi:hypothetical protein